MISTGCDNCCFYNKHQNDGCCLLGQFCVKKDGYTIAPGYCRICRSKKWAKKQQTTNIAELYQAVLKEMNLKFSLLVLFDEATHSLNDLQTTLDHDWYKQYAEKLCILDTTGFGQRKNIALQYLKIKRACCQITVDSSCEHEAADQVQRTLRRVVPQIDTTMFMVIPAGTKIWNMHLLEQTVRNVPNRVIHWQLPIMITNTVILPRQQYCGLFITKPYQALCKTYGEKTFCDALIEEEKETSMALSWPCEHVVIEG